MNKIYESAIITIFFIISSFSTFSQHCIWTGVSDTAWYNPLNWSCGHVPDSNTIVTISEDAQNPVYVPSNAQVKIWSLDVCSLNSFTMDSAKLLLMETYMVLSSDFGYGTRLSTYYTVDTDETMGPTGTTTGINDRRNMAHYSITPENTELRFPFLRLYTGVDRANYCIRYISKMIQNNFGTPQEQDRLKRMYGEVLVLKSQFYFDLIKNWGDVPYIESIKCPSQLAFNYSWYSHKNTNRDTTYAKILNDLQLAKSYLPWRSEVTLYGDTLDERITKGAAIALRAKVALFAGGYSLRSDSTRKRVSNYLDFYQIAKEECQALMNKREEHTLNLDYKSLWKNTVCRNKVDDGFGELIFQVAMWGGVAQTDSKLGTYNGPRIFASVGTVGNSSLMMIPTYLYLFDSVDKRRDVANAPYDFNEGNYIKTGRQSNQIRDGKFRMDWSNPLITSTQFSYTGINWPLIRFSDVLLMFAEADNEINNGPSADAIKAFEEVRKRGYGIDSNKIGTTPTSKSDFFNAIVKERSLEFGGEGIRKYDLIRWNLLESKLNETKTKLNLFFNRTAPFDNVPQYMFINKNSSEDNSAMWYNSYYHTNNGSTQTPSGTTRIIWTNSSMITSFANVFANGFSANKNELLPYPIDVLTNNPDMVQNPNY